MNNETKTATGEHPRKFRFVGTLLVAALALLAFESFYYFSAPQLDAQQKALLAWTGVPAPDFAVTNLDGQSFHLADLKGRRVILNFWATWCPPCQEEIPDFIKLRDQTSPTNVVILGLSADDAATQKAFAQRNGINYPLAVLQDVPSPYQDIAEIPVTMAIDRNGVIQNAVLGPQELKTLKQFATGPDYAGARKSIPVAKGQ